MAPFPFISAYQKFRAADNIFAHDTKKERERESGRCCGQLPMMHDQVMADFNIKDGGEFYVMNSLSVLTKINSLKTR